LAPNWARRSQLAFDRDVPALLTQGKPGALQNRFDRALGMRLFAPVAVSAERQGMVARENGRHAEARGAFALAQRSQGRAAPLAVRLGYAHACFAVGDDLAAIDAYRALIEAGDLLPGVERNLAHALIRQGQQLEEALGLLQRTEDTRRSPAERAEVDLVRALAHAKLGQRVEAERLLSAAEGRIQDSAAHAQAEAEVHAVLGAAVSRPRA
jgi:tetratricopeptide (TPR) repeat protein